MQPAQLTPQDAEFSRSDSATLAEQLAGRYAERIAQRLLAPGARLPSMREGARRHGVSPGTIVGAYDLLQARGLVQARPQRGAPRAWACACCPCRAPKPVPTWP